MGKTGGIYADFCLSFFLCEADDAEHARSLAERGETYQLLDERIVSARQLERNTFMSRWFFDVSARQRTRLTARLGPSKKGEPHENSAL
jgi:hypothetical protein